MVGSAGVLWRMLVIALSVVLMMALGGIVWTVADGNRDTSPDVIVTIFSGSLAGLLGLFVRMPRA
ncbi:MAG TPA: hypothetical protein VFR35_03850 [Actinoplanes sp.]|nr:hypothetical protein [Actinoplanes sp.]